jgi:CheY-like chemotaxis protein
MEVFSYNQKGDLGHEPNRLNCALVIDEADSLRKSVIALLRGHGWLVHGVNRAEMALRILVHIPYNLIVLNPDLPGISAMDFVRILGNSKEWRTIRIVVINSCEGPTWASQVAESGVFLARRSAWEEDLFRVLASLHLVPSSRLDGRSEVAPLQFRQGEEQESQ